MLDWLILNRGEGGMLRRYGVLGAFLLVGGYLMADGIMALMHEVMPDQTQRLSAHQAARESTRLYTLTRSVLDDQITTGSIPKVEPCGK